MIFPNLKDAHSLEEKLSLIERRDIDGLPLQFPNHLVLLSEFEYYRLRGRPQFLSENEHANLKEEVEEHLLVGMYSMQNPFCYLIDAYPDQIEIYFGSKSIDSSKDSTVHKGIFEGYWGYDYLTVDKKINEKIRTLDNYSVCGALTGIPVNIPPVPSIKRMVPSDHWMRSLQGRKWTYLVNGFCIPRNILTEYEDQIISEIALLKTRTIREDILYEDKRLAEHYQSLLEANLKRIEIARLTGAWQVGVYFFADDETLIRQGLGILGASFGHKKSIIQPVRAHLCCKATELKASFSNLLISSEVSPLVSIPQEEAPGYMIQKVARFDTATADFTGHEPITIGCVIRNQLITENRYRMELSDLTKHGLIAGVTGSGKTTTSFYLLRQLKEKGIPFLVVESAKSEYRQLLNDPLFGDMLVFTLGDETPENSAPFRINPFEVPKGILVQTHLDYIKSLFRASFVMYAPMPYVLDEALYEVYRDKGWNLSTNSNERGEGLSAFPTLTDLYEKIGEVVTRLGYDERISKDILAGLRTRVNNLRLGGKGFMLDTIQAVPIDEIMKKSVLLELKKIGNDDEKAFLIGIILARIYEYYEGTPRTGQAAKGLKHLTLIEEAHRLLKHVSEEASELDGNVRSKAVESFCNMLSEIRAYGEGVFVCEQIPCKLARDVMKNTNLKIMHRLVAKDDREIMGDTMNMSEVQKRYITTLDKGRAVLFAEGMDSPFLIYVPIKESLNPLVVSKAVPNRYIFQHMKEHFYHSNRDLLMKYRECRYCFTKKKRCESVRETIKTLLSRDENRLRFSKLFFAAAFGSLHVDPFSEIDRTIREQIVIGGNDDLKNIWLCFIIQAAYLSIEEQGRLYGYPFAAAEQLMDVFLDLIQSFIFHATIDRKKLETFQKVFFDLRTKSVSPYAGCYLCKKICVYRHEVSHLLKDTALNADFDYITTKIDDDLRMWNELAKLCKKATDKIISSQIISHSKGVILCYLTQKVAQKDWAPIVQEKTIRNINAVFEKGIDSV